MNMKTIYATLAAFVVSFLLGWLVYGYLLMDFLNANTTEYAGLMNEMPNMALMIISQLGWSFLIVYVLQNWAGGLTLAKGFGIGLTISFLVGFSFDMYIMAAMNLYTWTGAIVDILISTVFGGIIGVVAAWVLNFGAKKASA